MVKIQLVTLMSIIIISNVQAWGAIKHPNYQDLKNERYFNRAESILIEDLLIQSPANFDFKSRGVKKNVVNSDKSISFPVLKQLHNDLLPINDTKKIRSRIPIMGNFPKKCRFNMMTYRQECK